LDGRLLGLSWNKCGREEGESGDLNEHGTQRWHGGVDLHEGNAIRCGDGV